jgi:hypothetical protein
LSKRRTPDDFAADMAARRADLVPQQAEDRLPHLIEQAAAALAKATTAGEVLEARNQAAMAYNAAKIAARFAKLKDAHAEVLAACHRAQADALIIEARAQCRLADEYDAAQERGEVAKQGGARNFKIPNENFEPTTTDVGLTNKQVHEARKVRDAEKAEPGIVQHTVDAKLEAGDEPTHADVRRAVNRATAHKNEDIAEQEPQQPSAPQPVHKPRKSAAKLPPPADEAVEIEHDVASIRQALDGVAQATEILIYFGKLAAAQFKAARDQFETDDAFNTWLAENKLEGPDRIPALLSIGEHPDLARSIMVLIDEMLSDAYQRVTSINKDAENVHEAAAPEPVADPHPLSLHDPGPMPGFLDRTNNNKVAS